MDYDNIPTLMEEDFNSLRAKEGKKHFSSIVEG